MIMNKIFWIVIILLVIVGIWWLAGDKAPTPNPTTLIKIGVIAPLTGVIADYGEEVRKGVMAAQTEGVEFVFEDDKCEPAAAVTAFQKLTAIDQVKFIIGPACGSPQEAVVPLLKDSEALVVVPAAASQALFAQSEGKFFNAQYSLEAEASFLADQMFELGFKNVVLITYQNAFSKVHRDAFVAKFGGKVVKEITFLDTTTDLSTELAKLKTIPHDAIFSPDISFFFANGLEKLKQFGITTPVFAPYAVELPAARPLVEGVIYSFPGDLPGDQGATAALSQEAATLLAQYTKECAGVYVCVQEKLNSRTDFIAGVKQRSILLKKIEAGQAVLYR